MASFTVRSSYPHVKCEGAQCSVTAQSDTLSHDLDGCLAVHPLKRALTGKAISGEYSVLQGWTNCYRAVRPPLQWCWEATRHVRTRQGSTERRKICLDSRPIQQFPCAIDSLSSPRRHTPGLFGLILVHVIPYISPASLSPSQFYFSHLQFHLLFQILTIAAEPNHLGSIFPSLLQPLHPTAAFATHQTSHHHHLPQSWRLNQDYPLATRQGYLPLK